MINSLPHNPDFLAILTERAFENFVGKGENAGNIKKCTLFLEPSILSRLKMLSIWTSLKLCRLVKS